MFSSFIYYFIILFNILLKPALAQTSSNNTTPSVNKSKSLIRGTIAILKKKKKKKKLNMFQITRNMPKCLLTIDLLFTDLTSTYPQDGVCNVSHQHDLVIVPYD
jgi:hypothetical protein